MHKVRACSSLVCAGLLCLALLQPQPAAAAWPSDPLVNVPICTAASTQDYPVIVSDGAGGAIIAWHDYRRGGSDADIYAQRVSATGTVEWTVDGVALCTATGRQELPAIASDGAGGAIVAWRDLRNGATNDIYAQRISVDGTVQWTPDGVALCTAADEQAHPTIVSDGTGGAIVTWHDRRSGNFDIYAQRISAGGSVQWAANGVPLCTAVGDQAYPTIVPDGANGAVIAWYDYRGGPYSDIYVQRIAGGGTVQWTPNGVPLCVATGNQSDPAIASDGEGGAIVTWYDERSGTNSDIYAQRVSAAGAVQWTTDGVALCVATGRQYGAVTVADGAGGAIVAWSDERGGGSNADLYSQRISADGAVHWTANGVALCTATGTQSSPTLVSDGAHGALVTWSDLRSGNWDIYAQRISAMGTLQWATNGMALCTATADQKLSTIAADGAGGAIITWSDNRSGNDDIYAQRVQANGQLGGDVTDVPGGVSLAFALEPVRPNPSRGGGLTVQFTLVSAAAASLELLDVAGRRIAEREAGSLGAGHHSLELGAGFRLAPGLYLVRLRQGTNSRVTRVAVLR